MFIGNLHFAYATADDSLDTNIYKLVTFNQYLDQRLGGSYTRITVARRFSFCSYFSNVNINNTGQQILIFFLYIGLK